MTFPFPVLPVFLTLNVPPPNNLWGWWAADHSYTETSGTPTTLITVDGTAIGSQLDRSGNARHIYQATGTKKPAFKTNIVNSLPAARFNTVNATVLLSTALETGNFFSVYMVFNSTATAFNNSPFAFNDVGGNPRFALMDNGATALRVLDGGNGAQVSFSPTTYHLLAASVDNTSFNTQMQIDNGTNTGASCSPGGGNVATVAIGNSVVYGSWAGDILEVLLYNTVHSFGSGDGLLARKFLNSKYNLGLAL